MPMPFSFTRRAVLSLLAALIAAATACRADDRVTVFAAASLKTALDRIAEAHRDAGGAEIRIAYAASSALARQIEAGAPADLFFSANTAWMDALAEAGRIASETRRDLLTNRLALIAHRDGDGDGEDAPPAVIDADFDLLALLGPRGRLAVALVDAVPAGIYAKSSLDALGVWAAVAPRAVQADNVRAALTLVAAGAAAYGVVYATDAAAEPRVRLVGLFPEASHPPIRYPVAAVAGRRRAAVDAFLGYLEGEQARAIFSEAGFGAAPR